MAKQIDTVTVPYIAPKYKGCKGCGTCLVCELCPAWCKVQSKPDLELSQQDTPKTVGQKRSGKIAKKSP